MSQPNPINISYSSNNVSTCLGNDGSIDITVTGGNTPYTYFWSNSDTIQDISNLSSGIYSLNITDNNGCLDSITIIITEPPSVNINYSYTNPTCIGYNNGTIDLSLSSGTSPFIFNWSTSDTTEDITNLTQGIYSVTVTDSAGCNAISNNYLSRSTSSNNCNKFFSY